MLAHTVVGGLTGGINGAAGAAAATLAAPLVAAQLQQAGIDGALAKTLTALASTAAGAAAGGVAGAGTALNEVASNFLKHPEVAAFKRRLDGCEAQKGGCPDDQRKDILGTYLDISGKNIQELQTCTMQADAACLNRIQTEIARSAELPASLVGNEASVFIGRQANAQDDVARAQIYVKDIAKARQTICGSLPTLACDQKLKVAKGDATEKAAFLVLAALGGGVVPEGVALVNAGANFVLRTGQLAAAEAKSLASEGPVLYCAQLGSGGGCAAIVDAAMQIASGVFSPLSIVPVIAAAGAKAAQLVEGEVAGAARVAKVAGSGVAPAKSVVANSVGVLEEAAAGPVNFMGNGDQFFKNASKRLDVDANGTFDVVAHGSTQKIEVMTANGPVLVDQRVASKLIENSPGYNGQPIRLLSCDTGACDTGFAQNLANKMGVSVQAPTDLVWAYGNGKMVVAPRSSVNPSSPLYNVPDLTNQGAFKTFVPGKTK